MPGPYKKISRDEGWEVMGGNDEVLASVDTEALADVLLNHLVNGTMPPSFTEGVEYGENDGETPFRCATCGHVAEEEDFWPSDGNPAPHICPVCGSTDCFPDE